LVLIQVLWLWEEMAGEKQIERLTKDWKNLPEGRYMLVERLGYEFSDRLVLRSPATLKLFESLLEKYNPAAGREWMFLSSATAYMTRGWQDKGMQELTDRMINGRESPWNPSTLGASLTVEFMSTCFDSKRVLKVPAFRIALMRLLSDESDLGVSLTIEEKTPDKLTYVFKDAKRAEKISEGVEFKFAIGEVRSLRRCDLVAQKFSETLADRGKNPVLYHVLWSNEEREQGLEALREKIGSWEGN